jgi:hypothetical protein
LIEKLVLVFVPLVEMSETMKPIMKLQRSPTPRPQRRRPRPTAIPGEAGPSTSHTTYLTVPEEPYLSRLSVDPEQLETQGQEVRSPGDKEAIRVRFVQQLTSSPRSTEEYFLESGNEYSATSSELEVLARLLRDPNRHTNARKEFFRFVVFITIVIIAISLATSVVSNVLTLTQLQLFTSSEAFNIALQESSPVGNTNVSRRFVMHEAEGHRLLFWQRKIASTGTTPLLEMLFAVQHEIEMRKRAMNLVPAIRALLAAIQSARRMYASTFKVTTMIQISRKIIKQLQEDSSFESRLEMAVYLGAQTTDIDFDALFEF